MNWGIRYGTYTKIKPFFWQCVFCSHILTKYHFSFLSAIIRKGRNYKLISFSFCIFLILWLWKQSDDPWNFFQNSWRYSFNPGSISDSLYRTLQDSVSQTFLFVEPFWLRKITTDPHTLAYVNAYLRN